jgi:hypothetical protein
VAFRTIWHLVWLVKAETELLSLGVSNVSLILFEEKSGREFLKKDWMIFNGPVQLAYMSRVKLLRLVKAFFLVNPIHLYKKSDLSIYLPCP